LADRVELERSVLRKMCAATPGARSLSEAKKMLEPYVWRDADNRVVFESLCGLSSGLTSAQLREQLPAQATRLGFPDVAWENYFTQDDLDAGDVASLIEQLLKTE
jgi:hypothetical protein